MAFLMGMVKTESYRAPVKQSASVKAPISSGVDRKSSIINGRFEIEKKLGAGCFGEVWRGTDRKTNEKVAVKFEEVNAAAKVPIQLEGERDVLKLLAKPSQPQGFTELFWCGRVTGSACMVMEMLGKSLEARLEASGTFDAGTTTLLAEQILQRIEYLHSKGIVHRDIKPENFMFGVGEKAHHVYLIDFGLSKKYYEQHKHVPVMTGQPMTGTLRYISINTHKGLEQSRRDDLEAIAYMLIYFLRGSLPWSGLEAKTQGERTKKVREKKETTDPAILCEGHPEAFEMYLRATRRLKFEERPDYNALRKLFSDLRATIGPDEDHGFKFLADEIQNAEQLQPVEHCRVVMQPDDQVAKSSWACACGAKPNVLD